MHHHECSLSMPSATFLRCCFVIASFVAGFGLASCRFLLCSRVLTSAWLPLSRHESSCQCNSHAHIHPSHSFRSASGLSRWSCPRTPRKRTDAKSGRKAAKASHAQSVARRTREFHGTSRGGPNPLPFLCISNTRVMSYGYQHLHDAF